MNKFSDSVPESALPLPASHAMFDGTIAMSSGSLRPEKDEWLQEQLVPGLKLIVVDRGELLCDLPGSGRQHITGPCVCAVWNQQEGESRQRFEPGRQLDYTTIALTPAAVASHIDSEFQQQLEASFQSRRFSGPRLLVLEASATIKSLHAQVATCPMQGLSRALFLSGKALEIMAHALDSLISRPVQEAGSLRLSNSDIDKLHLARKLLAERMLNPPTLAELALSVGFNTRKLTVGFRCQFGESVFEYLQNLRLDTAWRMLTEGEVSVSTAAYSVGYTPAHFSVAFRKKFGVSPKSLRG
ncbi:AraC family transcriptional regulator [Erwinia sp. S38]|uniref:helix-turn-helix domain-containing protein n=1 Tax=Erwinia sp. S38 TaxID=2769338 RepID=UPI00190BF659|nr:AraC family transcriptional regulator [Erwinia sp. S38]MBK0000435.1 helix-turn-helix transcriptional regulator [Erwinia sp. S38]